MRAECLRAVWYGLGWVRGLFWVYFWLGWVWLAGGRGREGGTCSRSCSCGCSCAVVGGGNNIVRLGRNRIPVI